MASAPRSALAADAFRFAASLATPSLAISFGHAPDAIPSPMIMLSMAFRMRSCASSLRSSASIFSRSVIGASRWVQPFKLPKECTGPHQLAAMRRGTFRDSNRASITRVPGQRGHLRAKRKASDWGADWSPSTDRVASSVLSLTASTQARSPQPTSANSPVARVRLCSSATRRGRLRSRQDVPQHHTASTLRLRLARPASAPSAEPAHRKLPRQRRRAFRGFALGVIGRTTWGNLRIASR